MEHIASVDTGGGSARRKLGHRLDRPVPASMSAVIQQALFTRFCSMGVPVHEAIPIGHDLDEIDRECLEPYPIWIGVVKLFDCFGKTICDLPCCHSRGFLQKA